MTICNGPAVYKYLYDLQVPPCWFRFPLVSFKSSTCLALHVYLSSHYFFERLIMKGLLASLTLQSFDERCSSSRVDCRFRGLKMLRALGGLFVADLRASLALRRPPTVLGVPWVLDPSIVLEHSSRSTLPCLLFAAETFMSRICVSWRSSRIDRSLACDGRWVGISVLFGTSQRTIEFIAESCSLSCVLRAVVMFESCESCWSNSCVGCKLAYGATLAVAQYLAMGRSLPKVAHSLIAASLAWPRSRLHVEVWN